MNINVMIVSHRHFAGEDIAEILREHINSHPIEGVNVRFHVVYRVPYAVSMIPNMDIIIGNMHIKKATSNASAMAYTTASVRWLGYTTSLTSAQR